MEAKKNAIAIRIFELLEPDSEVRIVRKTAIINEVAVDLSYEKTKAKYLTTEYKEFPELKSIIDRLLIKLDACIEETNEQELNAIGVKVDALIEKAKEVILNQDVVGMRQYEDTAV